METISESRTILEVKRTSVAQSVGLPTAVYALRLDRDPKHGYTRHLLGYTRQLVANKEWEIVTYKEIPGEPKPVRDAVECKNTAVGAIKRLANLVGYDGQLPDLPTLPEQD